MSVEEAIARLLGLDKGEVRARIARRELKLGEVGGLRYAVATWLPGNPVAVVEPQLMYVPPAPRLTVKLVPEACRAGMVVGMLPAGYGVRIVVVDGKLVAFLDRGDPCPYTTAMLEPVRGTLASLIERELGSGTLYAIAAGASNPYNPFFQQQAKEFNITVVGGWREGEGPLDPTTFFELAEAYGLQPPVRLSACPLSSEEVSKIVVENDVRDVAAIAVYGPWMLVGYPTHSFLVELVRVSASRLDTEMATAAAILAAARLILLNLPPSRKNMVSVDVGSALVEGLWEALTRLRLEGSVTENIQLRLHRRGWELTYAVAELVKASSGLRGVEFRELGKGVEAVVERVLEDNLDRLEELARRIARMLKA